MVERDERGHFVVGNSGGGRPKGSGRGVRRIGREIISPGETPLEFLLKIMRNEGADTTNRVSAAVACLPYVHAKRRHDTTSFVFPTPASAVEATAMLATLPAKIGADGLDPRVATAVASALRSYLEAFRVSELEAKVRALGRRNP
jgi:energy-converting hydrogenase Eha subunit A